MTYRTILAYAETATDLERVMPVAMKVARNHGAHVVGLHVIRAPAVLVQSPYQIELLVEAEARLREAALRRAEELVVAFEAYADDEADTVAEWRMVEARGPAVEGSLIEHARCCDLTIMAQPDPATDRTNRLGTLGEVILRAGRPVLVVPYIGEVRSLGDTVFAAWNGTREGTRAVFDALPFLREASETRIYAVEAHDGGETVPPGAMLAETLARHGVRATVETAANGDMPVAATLLSRMADRGSDLMVMGGYGHSRAREYVFGGVTRDILKTMTVPVLFSH